MKRSALILAAATILPTVLAPVATHAAIQGSPRAVVMKLNGEGFRTCRQLGNSGYTALVQGEFVDGSGGGIYSEGFKRFRVRTCFETRKSCKRFVSRIENIVPGVDSVRLRRCEAR